MLLFSFIPNTVGASEFNYLQSNCVKKIIAFFNYCILDNINLIKNVGNLTINLLPTRTGDEIFANKTFLPPSYRQERQSWKVGNS